jgi:hypothetical protein
MESPRHLEVDLTAGCACGGTHLHLEGRVLSMFMCACEDCQRATGTGHSAFLIARTEDVTVSGPVKCFSTPSNSGASFKRCFCPECGTPIYGQSSRAPTIMSVPVGLFGAQAAGWFAPNQLIFARSHRDWDLLPVDIPHYQTYRDEEPR